MDEIDFEKEVSGERASSFKKMVDERSWGEFKDSGMLFIANLILQIFGWSLMMKINDDGAYDCVAIRTKFRGFSEDSFEKSYRKAYNYLRENLDDIESDLDY